MKNQNSGSLSRVPRGEFDASITVLENVGFKPWMLDLIRCPESSIAGQIVKLFLNIKLQEWKEFYKKYFNLDLDISRIEIPLPRKNFDRLMIVMPILSVKDVFDKLSQNIRCNWQTEKWNGKWHTNKEAILNFHNTEIKDYAFWVRDGLESDKKYLGHLTDENRTIDCPIENILEAFIHILKVWDECKKVINSRTNLLTYSLAFQNEFISLNYRGAGILYVILFEGFVRPQYSGPREVVRN